MKTIFNVLILSSIAFCTFANAAEFEVGQKDKKFTTDTIKVKVGDTVKFTNEDEFFHNVFSLSDSAMFDLGSYPKGESRTVKFEDAGTVEVECAIHPSMIMKVIVE